MKTGLAVTVTMLLAATAGCLDPTIKDGVLADYTTCRLAIVEDLAPVRVPCQFIGRDAPVTDTLPAGYLCVERQGLDGGDMRVHVGPSSDILMLQFRFDDGRDVVGGLLQAAFELSDSTDVWSWSHEGAGDAFVEVRLPEPATQPFRLDMRLVRSGIDEASEPLQDASVSTAWAIPVIEGEGFPMQVVHKFEAEGGPYYFGGNNLHRFAGADFALRISPSFTNAQYQGPPAPGFDSAGCAG